MERGKSARKSRLCTGTLARESNLLQLMQLLQTILVLFLQTAATILWQ